MVTYDWLVFTWAIHHPLKDLYNQGFVSPPWALLFLPHALLPPLIGVNLNRILTLLLIGYVIRKRGGDTISLLIVGTSMPLFWLMINGNIDFILFLGLLLPPSLGLIAFSAKPQAGIGMIPLYFKRYGWTAFVPVVIIVIASFVIYKNWIVHLTPIIIPGRQFQFFPWLVPVGVYLIYLSWHDNDDSWAALASLFLVPYYGFWSLTFPLALLSTKHKRVAILLWFGSWLYQAVIAYLF
jgi:hypothetical protein